MKVTQRELAAFLGVDPRTIRRWTRDGLPREPDGRYRTEAAVEWRIRQAIGAGEPSSNGTAPRPTAESEARLRQARAELAELELGERRGALIPLRVFNDTLEDICQRIRAKLMAVPLRWGQDVVGIEDQSEGTALLERAVAQVLEGLARTGSEMQADRDQEDGDD